MSAVYSWSRVQYSLCVSAGNFLSQKHDERVVGTLEILCLLAVQEHATGALRNLASNPDNRTAIAHAGGLSCLVSIVRDGSEAAKEQAVKLGKAAAERVRQAVASVQSES